MNFLKKKILQAMDRIAQGGLSLRELTIALPLNADKGAWRRKQVEQQLAELEALRPSPYARVPGVHAARWMLLHAPGDSVFPGPLLCSVVFEGDVDDVLFGIVETLKDQLAPLLAHCAGSSPPRQASACVAYLKRHRLESGYFFSDHRTKTLTEIQEALKVETAFRAFYGANQALPVAKIRENFAQFRAGAWRNTAHPEVGQDQPLSRPFERRQDQEEAWTRRATQLALRRQERDVRKARRTVPSAQKLRVAHAKHHGCVRARFVVNPDLDFRYQYGLFVPGNEFEAVLRFSNTSNAVRPDYEPDGRGVALKILNVGAAGEALVPGIPDGIPNAGTTQDFLMMSSPNFFAKNIRDFTMFRSILDVGTARERMPRLAAYFLPRTRELGVLARTFLRPVTHPLNVVYHSVTASMLGPHQAVKHSLRLKSGPKFDTPLSDLVNPNYLRDALQKTLHPDSGQSVELEFSIHVPNDERLSVEDSSLNWEQHDITRVPVATVIIEPQDFTTRAALDQCERTVFTPWHAIEAHKPLGSLNRARLAIYRASSLGRRVAP